MSDSDSFVDDLVHPFVEEGYDVGFNDDLVVITKDGDQIFHFRIGQITDENADNEEIVVEMTREGDIFYVSRFVIRPEEFKTFIRTQGYKKCRFENFAEHLSTILENARTNRAAYSVYFNDDALEVKQKLEFKTVNIFKLDFHSEERNSDYVSKQAQYRYHRKNTDFEDVNNHLIDLLEFVERKNPQLAAQLRKGLKYGKK